MVVTCYCCMHLAGVRIASSCCALRVGGARDEVRLACVRSRDAARWCGFSTFAFHYHMCVIAYTALTSRSTTAMSWMQKVRIGMTDSTFFGLSRG